MLPMNVFISDDDVHYICDIIHELQKITMKRSLDIFVCCGIICLCAGFAGGYVPCLAAGPLLSILYCPACGKICVFSDGEAAVYDCKC